MFIFERSLGILCSRRINFIPWGGYRKRDYVDNRFIVELLEMDPKVCTYKVQMYRRAFKRTTKEDVKKCFSLFKNVGYSSEYIFNNMQILTIPPSILKNYLLFYQECGLYKEKIGLAIVSRDHFVTAPVSVLKLYQFLPPNVDVLDNFLFHLGIPRTECGIETSDKNSLKELNLKTYQFFLMKELDVDKASLNKYKIRANQCISFQRLRGNVKILRKSLGYDNEKILSMSKILQNDPENILSTLGSPAGVHLKEVMFEDPSIMQLPFEKINEIDYILRMQGLDFSVLSKFPEVLNLENEELLYRICKLIQSPALNVFKNNPKLGVLLSNSRIAIERLNILKKLNMKCYSIQLLTCPSQTFLKHIFNGADQASSLDAVTYVSQKLGKSIAKTRCELHKNKFLRGVSILTIQKTLEYLLSVGFNDEEIFHSVQIVLYPRDVVENRLKELVMSSITVSDSQQIQVISKKFFLPLTMYLIEKDYNFSGGGVLGKSTASESSSDCSPEIKLLNAF